MKIGLMIYASLDTVSGGYLYDRKLVEYLRKQGDQVEILSIPWRRYPQHILDNFSGWLPRSMQSWDVDVLLQDELIHPSTAWCNRRWRRSTTAGHPPLIAIVHHLRSSEVRPAWQNRFYARVERRYLRSVDGFVPNSQNNRTEVETLLALDYATRSVVALPAGDRFKVSITDEEIVQRTRLAVPLQLVFVGNLIPRKGLHTLLQALMRIQRVDYELWVIGDSSMSPAYFRRLKRMAQDASLRSRVHFLGGLGDPQVQARLSASHLLVIPSSYEGYGIAYLEGMGFGLPSIACQAGAAHEIITPGVDGLLVPPGDPIALAQAIEFLGSDQARLVEFSRAARRRYLAQPGWEQTCERVREFLHTF